MSSSVSTPVSFPLVGPGGVAFGRVTVSWGPPGSRGVEVQADIPLDAAAKDAIEDALVAAWQHGSPQQDRPQPRAQVRLDSPQRVQRVAGSSLGLAVALAARASHPDAPHGSPWLPNAFVATGRVTRDGAVATVDELVEKAQALPAETLVAVFSTPEPGAPHPAMQDERVVEVRTLDEVWRLVAGAEPLRRLQARLWRRLDGKLPAPVPQAGAWLHSPHGLAGWHPDALGPSDPRLTLLRGPPGSGRSDALRAVADRIREDVVFGSVPDDLVLWAGGADRALEWALMGGAAVDGDRASAALLTHAPWSRATRIWVFADQTETEREALLSQIAHWLSVDARIQLILAVDEALHDERLDEAGLSARVVDLQPLWRAPERLTNAGRQGLALLSPLTRARVQREPRLLAAAQARVRRRAAVAPSAPDAPLERLWLHAVRADALAAWAGGSELAGDVVRLVARLLLFPERPPAPDSPDLKVPIASLGWDEWVGIRAAAASLDAPPAPRGAPDRASQDILLEWLRFDEDEPLYLEPPGDVRADLLAHAFRTSPIWPNMCYLPESSAWLRARDPVLRPVLIDVLAERMVEVGVGPGADPEALEDARDVCQVLAWGVLEDAAAADLRLLAGLLLRAVWVAADQTPEIVPVVTESVVAALLDHGPRRGWTALWSALRDALFSPQALDLLLACPAASLALLDGVEQAALRHRSARSVRDRMRDLGPLRALLHGDPAPAVGRLAANRPAPSDRQGLGPGVLERFDAFPPYGSADAYLDLIWTGSVLPPPPDAPALLPAVCALADTHWAAVAAWLDWPGLGQLDHEEVAEFLNDQWLALEEVHQPWHTRWRARLRPRLRARADELGVELDVFFDQSQRGAGMLVELRQIVWDRGTGTVTSPKHEA